MFSEGTHSVLIGSWPDNEGGEIVRKNRDYCAHHKQVAIMNHGKICKYVSIKYSPELVQRGLRDAGNAGGHGHEEGRGAQRRVDRHHRRPEGDTDV